MEPNADKRRKDHGKMCRHMSSRLRVKQRRGTKGPFRSRLRSGTAGLQPSPQSAARTLFHLAVIP